MLRLHRKYKSPYPLVGLVVFLAFSVKLPTVAYNPRRTCFSVPLYRHSYFRCHWPKHDTSGWDRRRQQRGVNAVAKSFPLIFIPNFDSSSSILLMVISAYSMNRKGEKYILVVLFFGGRNINNLRNADDTTFLSEIREGLKHLIKMVKEEMRNVVSF